LGQREAGQVREGLTVTEYVAFRNAKPAFAARRTLLVLDD
jgi:hypothetical protein